MDRKLGWNWNRPELACLALLFIQTTFIGTFAEPDVIAVWSGALTTSSIRVHWNDTSDGKHRINYFATDQGIDQAMFTSWLDSTVNVYKLLHLPANTNFNVCVTSQTSSVSKCVQIATIPLIRTSSIVALCITLGYIVLTVLFSFVWWRCQKMARERKKQRKQPVDLQSYRNRSIEEEEGTNEYRQAPSSGKPAVTGRAIRPTACNDVNDPGAVDDTHM